MRKDRVHVEFDFETKHQEPFVISNKVAKMLKESDFENKNFVISVDPIKQREVKDGRSK